MDADYELDDEILIGQNDNLSAGYKALSLPHLLPSQHKTIELLSHLASYSELLVTVSGPDGSGKSVLAQALASLREDPEDALLLTGDLMLGMPGILGAIADRWDLPRLPDDLVAARERVRNAAIEKSDAGYSLTVIIDQAEQLDAGTLNEIAHFALLVPQIISFSLFGLTGFEDAIRANPANAPLHRVELEPLTLDDAAILLQEALSPGQPLPLSHDELLSIWESSGGWPGALLHEAEDYLLGSVAPAPVAHVQAKSRFPVTHILAITAVAAALAMSFLYSDYSAQNIESTDASSGSILATAPATSGLAGAADVPGADIAPATEEEPLPESESALSAFDGETAEINPPVVATQPDYNYGGAKPVEPASSVQPELESNVADTRTEASEPEVKKVSPVAQPAKAVDAVAKVNKPVVTQSEATQSKATQSKATKPADTKVASPKAVATTRTAAEQQLLAAKEGFVVQLFGTYKADNASSFRKEWQDQVAGSLYQYQASHEGKPWHVVVCGIFATRAEAQAAVNAMPQTLRKQSPWIRDVRAVQEALR
ncbi:AAA family ATPase [Thalassolituus sp. LLYu03]|uniref:AAA family ATPase n=1 Tax=Thalassolituus sp. LLYu03 TaxID=3421656 RepID=UPI003D2DFBB8